MTARPAETPDQPTVEPVKAFYTLRYIAGTDLRDRKHRWTEVREETWAEAEDRRLAMPPTLRDALEVVVRGGER